MVKLPRSRSPPVNNQDKNHTDFMYQCDEQYNIFHDPF